VDAEGVEWEWDLIWEMVAGWTCVVFSRFSLGLRAGVLYAGKFGDLMMSVPSLMFNLPLHENSPVSGL
jgi:hypothetical protein